MFDLVIAEKPSQGKALADALGAKSSKKGYREGSGVIVTWCFGHLLELKMPHEYNPAWKNRSAEFLPIIPDNFDKKIKKGCSEQLRLIKGLLSKARRVIVATDFDREGEVIGRDVINKGRFKGEILRAHYRSYEKTEIERAWLNLKPIKETDGMDKAARARDILDWLLGMNISRAVSANVSRNSKFIPAYGRVQTSALLICVKREREIASFKEEVHFGIDIEVGSQSYIFDAQLIVPDNLLDDRGYLLDKTVANALRNQLNGLTGKVVEKSTTPNKKNAPLPYHLTALIEDAAKHGLDPEDTNNAIQTLYDPPLSLVTYPRTDVGYLPTEVLSSVPNILQHVTQTFPSISDTELDTRKIGPCWNDKKLEGHSHHGIIPTSISLADMSKLNSSQAIVYELICRRFAMQFAPEHQTESHKVTLQIGPLTFEKKGTCLIDSGWKSLAMKSGDKSNEFTIPNVNVDETIVVRSAYLVEKKTTPPTRYTLASLISEMGRASKHCSNPNLKKVLKETDGIGTEATRTDVVTALKKKNQIIVNKDKKIHVPDEVIRFCEGIPRTLTSVDTTATLELMLNSVEKGDMSFDDLLAEQKKFVTEMVATLLK
ncbi:TPA: hypothetical protein I7682_17935 [Vibrio vulnificus]|nr:hypothetical protein [Vibrio vulnificus]